MKEYEHPAVQRIVEWLTRGTPPDQTAVLVIAPTLQYMRSTIMRPLEKWPELAGADIVYIPYYDDVLMKAAGIHRRFLLVLVMGDPNENALLAAHLLTNNSNSEIAFYLHEA